LGTNAVDPSAAAGHAAPVLPAWLKKQWQAIVHRLPLRILDETRKFAVSSGKQAQEVIKKIVGYQGTLR